MSDQSLRYKIVMLGNTGVGKTAFVERVTDDVFIDEHVPTVGAQYVSLNMKVNDKSIVLEIWDTAGQEVFRSLVGFYAREAKGVFILFDVTEESSFEELQNWIDFSKEQSPEAKIMVFANKCDLEDKRKVSSEKFLEFVSAHDLLYEEGSAKTGESVRSAVETMAEKVMDLGKVKNVALDIEKTPEPKDKKGCC